MPTVTRVLSSIFGIFFLVISVPMIVGGVACLAVPAFLSDSQGYMNSPTFHLENANSYAFISQPFFLGDNNDHYYPGSDSHSSVNFYSSLDFSKIVNIRITSESSFIGLAPSSDVNQYLSNVQFDIVDEMNDHYISTHSLNVNKNGPLSSGPLNQTFWIASGVGVLYYTPSSSDFNKDLTFVVMKADGSQGVNSDLRIGVNAPILKIVGVILLVIGTVFFVVTIILFVVAYKSKGHPRPVTYFATFPQQQYHSQPDKSQANTIPKEQLSPLITSYIYCPSCGVKSEEGTNFCEVCGYSFNK